MTDVDVKSTPDVDVIETPDVDVLGLDEGGQSVGGTLTLQANTNRMARFFRNSQGNCIFSKQTNRMARFFRRVGTI